MGPEVDAGQPNVVISEIFGLEAEVARPDVRRSSGLKSTRPNVVVGLDIFRPEAEAGRPNVVIVGPEAKAVASRPTTFGRSAP